MEIGAIIAEYNPLHKGHVYQIEQLKASGADCVIVLMSGNFTQRGIPAVFDKYTRCQLALENGADLILELPVYFATGSAEFFAKGAVSILNQLGCIDILHFGSESGDITSLTDCAHILSNEPDAFKSLLSQYIKEGLSFPKARSMALSSYLVQNQLNPEIASLCESPNNILGIEYLKALMQCHSSIKPMTISRQDAQYHDPALPVCKSSFASASAIRSALYVGNKQETESFLPATAYSYIMQPSSKMMFEQDFSSILLYKLLEESQTRDFSHFYDVSAQLSDIILKNLSSFTFWDEFVLTCKSKEYTYARINRCLLHILLQMEQDTIEQIKNNPEHLYARILGFNQTGQAALNEIKKQSSIPLLTKLADASKKLDSIGNQILDADLYATKIYESTRAQKYHIKMENEFLRSVIRI